MFRNKKRNIFLLILFASGIFIGFKKCNQKLIAKPNPVPLNIIKELAERYKPIVVFDKNTLFYPVKFDGLKKIALEVDKQVVGEVEITEGLKMASNKMKHPQELFDSTYANGLIYYYSLSTIPEQWQLEKTLHSFPDTLNLYVNGSYDQFLKITYTIPFEGNDWRNHHRGDGAMFALYFDKVDGVYQPIKARAYMHLQYNEVDYKKNIAVTSSEEKKPIFFVTSGSHSTYHRAGKYKNVDGLPLIDVSETAKNDYTYCSDRTHLVFTDQTSNNIEKWAFLGDVYWGGSPNDRIYAKDDKTGKVPLVRSLPLGNRSARMIFDPSIVFDKKSYDGADFPVDSLRIDCGNNE